MPYGLYLSSEGAHAQSLRLDVISHNLANVDTVGFKRELAVCQARYAEAIEEGSSMPGLGSIDDVGGGIMVRETLTDFSPGPLKPTGTRTDVAIKAEGFFKVRKGEEIFLTRAGNFTIASNGHLTTQQGYDVLDESDGPIVILDPRWHVNESGTIWKQGGVQNLALVKPNSLGDLTRAGENLFKPLGDVEPLGASDRKVASGYLESSSVRPTSEMVDLIQASRALEANINLMKAQDQMLGGLVNRVMKT